MIGQLHRVIHDIEHEWAGKRLLVVGDVMLDKYIWGEVGRISPEAPVPVVRGMRQDEKPGGAANVAMNMARLGAQTGVVGITGDDENERLLADRLRSNGVDTQLRRIGRISRPSPRRAFWADASRCCAWTSSAWAPSHRKPTTSGLSKNALALLPGSHALVLSDYAKGVITPEVCQALIPAARRLGIPVLVDPKGLDYSHYRGATTICPNLGELARAARLDPGNLDALLTAAEAMVTATRSSSS